jgi:hypothetical protein
MTDPHETPRRLLPTQESQYFGRKSLFDGPPGRKKASGRKDVREEAAYYVAAFADGGGT